MLHAALCFLTNRQGGDLAQMKISDTLSPEYRSLGAVVVHTIAVLFSNYEMQILQPFISMLGNPAALTVRHSYV